MPGHNKHTKTPEAQQKPYPKLGNSIQHLDWITNRIKTEQSSEEIILNSTYTKPSYS